MRAQIDLSLFLLLRVFVCVCVRACVRLLVFVWVLCSNDGKFENMLCQTIPAPSQCWSDRYLLYKYSFMDGHVVHWLNLDLRQRARAGKAMKGTMKKGGIE